MDIDRFRELQLLTEVCQERFGLFIVPRSRDVCA